MKLLLFFLLIINFRFFSFSSDLFIVGSQAITQKPQASLWINHPDGSVKKTILLSSSPFESVAFSVTSVKNEIFCAGFQNNGTIDIATIWKTNIDGENLSSFAVGNQNKSSAINSIISFNGLLFASGKQNYSSKEIATIWVIHPDSEEILQTITLGELDKNSRAYCLSCDSNTIYCGGYQSNNINVTANLWVLNPLNYAFSSYRIGELGKNSYIFSIFNNINKLLLGGGLRSGNYDLTTLWIVDKQTFNVISSTFDYPPNEGYIDGIAKANGEVFSVGPRIEDFPQPRAVIWKSNNKGQNITVFPLGKIQKTSAAYDILSLNNKLFCTGYQFLNNTPPIAYNATLWITSPSFSFLDSVVLSKFNSIAYTIYSIPPSSSPVNKNFFPIYKPTKPGKSLL